MGPMSDLLLRRNSTSRAEARRCERLGHVLAFVLTAHNTVDRVMTPERLDWETEHPPAATRNDLFRLVSLPCHRSPP
jgi:hypothetical protein